jgi:hypothetical protein
MFKYSIPAQASTAALISVLFSFSSIEPVKAQASPLVPNPYENERQIPLVSNPYESDGEQKKPEAKNPSEFKSSSDLSIKVGGSLGYEQVNKQGGFGINGNLNANLYNFTASVEVVDFFFYGNGGSTGYYTDTFSNGQSRCRNASNGRFATSSSCSPNIGIDVKFLRNADLSYGLPIDSAGNKIFLGAGIPINDSSYNGAHGIFGYQSSSGGLVKAKVGNDMLDIRIGF